MRLGNQTDDLERVVERRAAGSSAAAARTACESVGLLAYQD